MVAIARCALGQKRMRDCCWCDNKKVQWKDIVELSMEGTNEPELLLN